MKTEKYNVTGMTCAACQANVTRCVSKLEGVEDVNVSLLANQMTVSYDETKLQPDTIVQAVEKVGYGASSLEQQPAALETAADFFHCPACAFDVYCHGSYDGAAGTLVLCGGREFLDLRFGTAAFDHPCAVHQPSFFPNRVQGPAA